MSEYLPLYLRYVSSLVAAYCINHTLSPPQQLPLVNVAVQQLRPRGGVRNRVLTASVLAEGNVGRGAGGVWLTEHQDPI